ncbi:MAG: branched-chain amino acid aminotransferase [Frankiaceae bacterium]|nr:branched-chain amino acid aminotransferase [Frankiaceae bacterium]
MKTWVNGDLLDSGAPAVRADDRGLLVGDGVFETMKVLGGTPFALTRHLDRLRRSADGMFLAVPSDAELRAAVVATLAANAADLPGGDARLRITVTGGPGPMGSVRGSSPPTLIVTTGKLPEYSGPARVVTVPWPRNERAATAGIKTTSYADNVVALAYAHERGGDEAIFPNTAGQLCEGSGTNVFVGIGGRLLTPPLNAGCLAGVTRALLLEWTDAEEAELPLSALAEADEAFLASTTRDVHPISHVDGRALPCVGGPLSQAAGAAFAQRAALELDA